MIAENMVFLKRYMGSEISMAEVAKETDEPLHLNFEETIKKGYQKVKGPSGRSLRISATKNHLSITAVDNEDIYLNMAVVTKEAGRFLSLGLNTKGQAGQPQHPDLNAGKLVDKAISYYNRQTPLTGIEFKWHDDFQKDETGKKVPSETLTQYLQTKANRLQYYNENGLGNDEAKEKAMKDAALSTWTGQRVALKHGFTQIQHLEEITNNGEITSVLGEFVRPSEQPSGELLNAV